MFKRIELSATIERGELEQEVVFVATLFSEEGDEMFVTGKGSGDEATDWLWSLCRERSSETGEHFIPRIRRDY